MLYKLRDNCCALSFFLLLVWSLLEYDPHFLTLYNNKLHNFSNFLWLYFWQTEKSKLHFHQTQMKAGFTWCHKDSVSLLLLSCASSILGSFSSNSKLLSQQHWNSAGKEPLLPNNSSKRSSRFGKAKECSHHSSWRMFPSLGTEAESGEVAGQRKIMTQLSREREKGAIYCPKTIYSYPQKIFN